ncbi:hypothetical protein QBC40DRAFT_347611 [Triangularia verruculosa]|uniref:Uncharacterized protein n=1 Tax=Triangularia verruculosa TaxID=2587418 RepID=A0AAN6XIZ3_9PEZI|nr:hypothetical protein QBC40DRAFT_347611 [Triangularia verruculosa]
MSALHYSRISGGLRESDMEETYLYHKLEAMRSVNRKVADPATCTSDGCLSLIAGLALAESGLGDPTAAEAHINGLCTLIDMKRPEEWQHRFYGMLQRVILMAGSYIAAARDPRLESQIIETDDMTLCYSHPYFPRPTSTLLSTTRVQATTLSPFYLTSTPCLEACKSDTEGEVLFNALQRLTALCFSPHESSNRETAALLLSDTESYIASLLFQPDSPSASQNRHSKQRKKKEHPYSQTPPVYFPSLSRAWAAAGYLYSHYILSPLWSHINPLDKTIDPDLLWYLLNTLQEDITKTEEAMKTGSYSSELWIWKVIIGAYAVQISFGSQYKDLAMKEMNTAEVNRELREIFGDLFSPTTTPTQPVLWHEPIYQRALASSSKPQDSSDDSFLNDDDVGLEHGYFNHEEYSHALAPSPLPGDYLH